MEKKTRDRITIDFKSLSDINLFSIIQDLKESNHPDLLKMAQKELINRLKKKKGFGNQKIAKILTANVYGITKRKQIAKEWAAALDISTKDFLNCKSQPLAGQSVPLRS